MSHKLVSLYIGEGEYYTRTDADKVIAEKDAEIAQLQAMLEERNKQVGKLTENVRRLKRSLWHAIALFCARSCEYFNGIMSHCLIGQDDLYRQCEEKKNKYLNAVYKCRAKEKEYK